MGDKFAAYPLMLLGIGIMVLSCFSEVTLVPGIGFGALLLVAGISLQFSSDGASSPRRDRSASGTETRDEMIATVSALNGRPHRRGHRSCSFDTLVTSVRYRGFDILVTRTPLTGYSAAIRGLNTTVEGYASTDGALKAAKQHIDTVVVANL